MHTYIFDILKQNKQSKLTEKNKMQIIFYLIFLLVKIVSEHDQEIPKSQTADKMMEPQGRVMKHFFSKLIQILRSKSHRSYFQ